MGDLSMRCMNESGLSMNFATIYIKKPLYLQRSVRCHISEDLSAVRINGSCFGFGRVTSRFELCFQLAGEFLFTRFKGAALIEDRSVFPP